MSCISSSLASISFLGGELNSRLFTWKTDGITIDKLTIDGWVTCLLKALSSVFQSYANGRKIRKGCM